MTSRNDDRDIELEIENDPLIDSLLDEVLNGDGPPDLKQAILQRHRSRAELGQSAAERPVSPPPVEPTAEAFRSRRRHPKRRQGRKWSAWSLSIVSSLLVLAAVWFAFRTPMASTPPIARRGGSDDAQPSIVPLRDVWPNSDHDDPTPNGKSDASSAGDVERGAVPDEGTNGDATSNPAADPPVGEPAVDNAHVPPIDPRELARTRLASAQVIEAVNDRLRRRWQRRKIVPAAEVDDATWIDRVYRELIGRGPRSAELREALGQPTQVARSVLVERLLGSEYASEFARHWSRRLGGWLLQGIAHDAPAFRVGLQNYLAGQLRNDRPYDELCLELISAKGSNDPDNDDFHGATNYVLAVGNRATAADLTAHVGRTMLGKRIVCAKCHHDRRLRRTQQEFWQLTAALNSVETRVLRPQRRGRLHDLSASDDLTVQYTGPDGQSHRAAPAGIDGQPLQLTTTKSPRRQLAEQIVASSDFASATINWFWQAFLNYGFTIPVDDRGRHNPTGSPELSALLAEQFAAHNYDVRHLMRWIVLSDAFNRSDRFLAVSAADAPAEGGEALFSRYYHRSQLFAAPSDGLAQLATGNAPRLMHTLDDDQRTDVVLGRYGAARDASAGENRRSQHDRMGRLLPPHWMSLIRSLASDVNLDNRELFDHAYLAVLGRHPRKAETNRAEAIFRADEGDRVLTLERIFWALHNSQ